MMAEEEDFISKILEGDALESICRLGTGNLAKTKDFFFKESVVDKTNS